MSARLETLLDLAAAAGALLYVAAVVVRCEPGRVQRRLAALLLFLAVGFGCRGHQALTAAAWSRHLQYLGFGLFPLGALLYAEAVTGRRVPLVLKVLALLATGFFGITWAGAWSQARGWMLAMMGYQLAALVWVFAALVATAAARRQGPGRSTLVAMSALGAAALVAVVSENRDALGGRWPRLGAAGLLLVTYVAACSFHAGGLWRVRGMLGRLALFAAASLLLARALAALVEGAPADLAVWASVLPVIAFLVLDPIRVAVTQNELRRADALLGRLARLRTDDFERYVENLRGWPELREVKVLTAAELAAGGYDQMDRHFLAHPGPADRAALLARLARGSTAPSLAAEQVLDLLEQQRCDFLVPLSAGAVMTVAVDGFLDRGALRQALYPIAELSRVLHARRSAPEAVAC